MGVTAVSLNPLSGDRAANEEESIENLTAEICQKLEALESSLPKRIDFPPSLPPSKALLYRASLAWRMVDLSRGTIENFKKDRRASASLGTRAVLETCAALRYLHQKLDAAVKADTVDDIDCYLDKLIMGAASKRAKRPLHESMESMPEAINVLTFVDLVDKDVKDFRYRYDLFSEVSHPNWAGTVYLYAKQENSWADFGMNIQGDDGMNQLCLSVLREALIIFETCHRLIGDVMPSFITLCEKQPKSTI